MVGIALLLSHHPPQPSSTAPSIKHNTSSLSTRADRCDWDNISWNNEETNTDTPHCQKAHTSGSWLMCMLNAKTYKDSKWTDPKQLDEYGWNSMVTTSSGIMQMGIFEPLISLRIAWENSAWRRVESAHQKAKTIDGRTWFPTRGRYQNYVNLADGALLAYYNFSPDTMNARQDGPRKLQPNEIVPLKQWSDVMFLDWKRECNSDPTCMRNLKHIFRVNVVNGATMDILQSIAEVDVLDGRHQWPGIQLKMDDPRALAALGTPNGNGIAWFLGQHKTELGHKIIDQVNVFNCASDPLTSGKWCMYFHVVDASH